MIKSAASLAQKLELVFTDESLLVEALTHRSAGSRNNERLEFLGDSILGFVVADRLFGLNRTASEGDLSRMRATLVKRETLADIALHWDVGAHLRLGSGELKSGGFRRQSILADALESIIGAVYKDQGITAARELIDRLYGARFQELASSPVVKDAKSRLQEWLQGKGQALPEYEVTTETGPPHRRLFNVTCHVHEAELTVAGSGSSRRSAEQDAAENALAQLLDSSVASSNSAS